MPIRIVGGTLRDLSYTASNLRPEDKAEADAQFDEWTPASIAAACLRDHCYVAEFDGNPEAAFGAGEIRNGQWVAWSFLTPRGWRAVPRITHFVRAVMFPDIYASGGQRVEARALADNASARRWLARMGAVEDCILKNYGTRGEDFVLVSWARCRFDGVSAFVLHEPSAQAHTAAQNT